MLSLPSPFAFPSTESSTSPKFVHMLCTEDKEEGILATGYLVCVCVATRVCVCILFSPVMVPFPHQSTIVMG